ncbi:FAD/NAD(P)-binding oxidoreductase [Agromyces sp. H66]|uniref:NAD(P)/FAD-dependent oxidoreductase n=1 Tax=Agromyces sp. H66 TaxID=2529859 RepID=UPI0010A9CC59|nr:FAD/NAD(P)-binding oxidoreductase [Agromyces sp. H66]
MARIVILGAGVAGHTAALHAKRKLGADHEVVVVSPNSKWNWIPSNIWVGVGRMPAEKVVFPLAPIYRRKHIEFHQALATAIRPDGDAEDARGAVDIRYTDPKRSGQTARLRYDYLINATGPKLRFEATPGLGPDGGHTASVCTPGHAVDAAAQLDDVIARLRAGQRQTVVVGIGHGTCTCEGAAFEYALNVDHELREAGVRDRAEVVYLSNEPELGDFGVGGMVFEEKGRRVTSSEWMESLFHERDVRAITHAAPTEITDRVIHYDSVADGPGSIEYDFAMLLPPFGGVGLEAYDRDGNDITSELFAPSGFMLVDADYGDKPFDEWRAADWPRTYRSPRNPNIFGVGIAFAPPHAITRPARTAAGVVVAPAPPRTGMPSGMMGKIAAFTIVDLIRQGGDARPHEAPMPELAAACIASTGAHMLRGSAATMTMSPVVPDYQRYPDTAGRDIAETRGEIGLAGHWLKRMLHTAFIYKAKALPFWYLIPE